MVHRLPDSVVRITISRPNLIAVINLGDSHVHVAGDVSDKNMAMVQAAVAQSKLDMRDEMVRNLPQIQRDAGQY